MTIREVTFLRSLTVFGSSKRGGERLIAWFGPSRGLHRASFLNLDPITGSFQDSRTLAEEESRDGHLTSNNSCTESNNLTTLTLEYTKKELKDYTLFRIAGISKGTIPWINKQSKTFWSATKGKINKASIEALREYTLTRYTDIYAKRKALNFSRAFPRYLAKTRFDARYKEFDLFLGMSKSVKESKQVTQRIITIEDIRKVLSVVKESYEKCEFTERQSLNYRAIVLFGAYTGQRPIATIRKLTVGQFLTALHHDPPVLEVLPQ